MSGKIEILPQASESSSAPMSGDYIIEHPEAAWDTTVIVPVSPEEVWSGRLGITRMGPLSEGGAGVPLPPRLDKYLPGGKLKDFRSLPDDAPMPRELHVGDSVPDGHKDDRAVVVERDDGARTIVFDMQWSPKGEQPGLHYTWQLQVEEGSASGTTNLTARTRMEHLKRPELWAKFGPGIDRSAMKLISEGIARDESVSGISERRQRARRIIAGGAAGGLVARELSKGSPSKAVRLAAPIAGAVIGAAVGSRTKPKP